MKSRKIIEVLGKEISIQLLADCTLSRSKECGKRTGRPETRSILQLFAILYGPSNLFDAVGTFAAKCHLYLQHPLYCDQNVPYRNPHCLSPEGGLVVFTFDLRSAHGTFSYPGLDISANPIDLFADIAEQDALCEANAPQNLSTELYAHQKQALTFMTQRERGWATDGNRKDIWKEEQGPFGRLMYQNLISGMRQMTRPVQFRGGLLIDAPGLGKSLSIIALILSDAEGQGRSIQETSPLSPTLLVVPKTCEVGLIPRVSGP